MGAGRMIPHHTLIEVQLPIQSAQGKDRIHWAFRQLQGCKFFLTIERLFYIYIMKREASKTVEPESQLFCHRESSMPAYKRMLDLLEVR